LYLEVLMIEPAHHDLHFCGIRPQELAFGRRPQARWNKRHLRWCIINRLPQFTLEQQTAAFEWAFNQYRIATNGWFSYEQTTLADSADIVLTTFRDRPNGVLADMQLPPGDDRQLLGRFDAAEPWDRTPQSVKLGLTAMHEFGHAHGMDHIDDRSQPSVLDSIYNGSLLTLQPLDIKVLLSKYPEAAALPKIDPEAPAPKPPEPTKPTPPAGSPYEPGPVTIVFGDGATWVSDKWKRIL
jgi:hypothetical protein